MPEFTQKALSLLDGIYRFVGGTRGVNKVDLASPIVLVHDVSREAELAGIGGYFGRLHWGGSVNHGAANTQIERMSRVTDVEPVLQLDNELYELWLLEASFVVSNADKADLTSLTLWKGPAGNSMRNIVGTAQAIKAPVMTLAAADLLEVTSSSGTTQWWAYSERPWPPVRIVPNGYVGLYSISSAAMTYFYDLVFWAGALGSTPPGIR